MGPRRRRAVGGAAASDAAADPRLVRGDRAGLPLARPAVGHAVRRRGATRQDDPPPRLLAHRRHLRLRRAHHGPAPPRHPADERPAAAAAGQGQHGARRGARAGDDRDRRSRRRPRPRRRHGVKPALFSANSEGACPNCNGVGVIYTDLAMMAGVATTCEECEGKRFEASVLDYHLGGRDISEVLAMPVTEAEEFFGTGEARTPAAHAILGRLADVGLGYLSIGQPLTTLSGGERQRLKLATHMAEKGGVYVLDEPTTGLHLADVEQLLGLLDRLVDAGKSVIVIEHHQAVMAHADWIIDLGPGAGHDGGRIVFEGTPADLVAARSTLTGEHLAAYVGT